MSIVPKETIVVIAQSIGINSLSPDVALAFAPDVEYRMREIMQKAIKCMHHSKRTMLTTDDVDSALNLRNVEVIEAPLPKAPLYTSIVCHWLAIAGVQPATPENAPVEVIVAPSDNKKPEQKYDLPVDIKLPVKHILSRELQLYFDKITEVAVTRSDLVLFKEALESLATDLGLHPLVPYFTYFIVDELHQLMPSVVTCLVAKRLGNRFADNHWELRDFTTNLVASICKRFL
ncbi:hypothetical protein ACSBR1_012201 [Camellia fascicularis]